MLNSHYPFRFQERELPEKCGVHHAEDGRVRPDAQAQSQYRYDREAGIGPKSPDCEFQVSKERFHAADLKAICGP
jgi:hypothetical protein